MWQIAPRVYTGRCRPSSKPFVRDGPSARPGPIAAASLTRSLSELTGPGIGDSGMDGDARGDLQLKLRLAP
jgi:hypothetical protein